MSGWTLPEQHDWNAESAFQPGGLHRISWKLGGDKLRALKDMARRVRLPRSAVLMATVALTMNRLGGSDPGDKGRGKRKPESKSRISVLCWRRIFGDLRLEQSLGSANA